MKKIKHYYYNFKVGYKYFEKGREKRKYERISWMNEMLDEPKKNINTHHLLGEDEINNVGEIKIEDTKLRKLHEEIEEEIEDTIKSISRDLRYYLIRTEIKL